MYIRMIGDGREVIGFSLAGAESTVCRTPPELAAALDAAQHDPGVAIVVLSPGAAALDTDRVERMRAACRLPIAIVLP